MRNGVNAMSDCCGGEAKDQRERKLLWWVLSLNALMFVVEFGAGWVANSSGLLADSLDMLADAAVYAVSLYAVGRSRAHKTRAALVNGCLQWGLGMLVLVETARRVVQGKPPETDIMLAVALLALIVNVACFLLLYAYRRGDINLRSSWICSRNDVLANAGVLVAAGLVIWLDSPWPDWIIGGLIASLILFSAGNIIRGARHVADNDTSGPSCSNK